MAAQKSNDVPFPSKMRRASTGVFRISCPFRWRRTSPKALSATAENPVPLANPDCAAVSRSYPAAWGMGPRAAIVRLARASISVHRSSAMSVAEASQEPPTANTDGIAR